ncbi:hypothetical protein GCM10007103_34680 [Salinimicrobium marinum]|uniref:Calx-beta domain-containing protein n=1 Tax=Salinimicrobium marinum TaxID=680283 RepID=A0A918W1U8_9FLAO|nr:hypothetical protein [Salinimicrobium marinum]GHA51164.1 hypothetical protein GCM10007103_34680 [Salinimicrobium marinum]
MKKHLGIFLAIISASFLVACDLETDYNPPNYATFENWPEDVEVDLGGSTTVDITVYTANVVGSDRTFDVLVTEATTLSTDAYSVPGSVTVPGGSNEGVLTVDISDIDISPVGETLVLNLANEEGLFVGDPVTVNVSQLCPYPEFRINFAFDDYASETSWEIRDSEDNLLFEGAGFSDGTASASVKRCLDTGDYTFTVRDSYGDGLADGSVTLTYAGDDLVEIPGDFGEGATVNFTLGSGGGDTDGDDTDGDDTDGGDTDGDDSEE